MKKFLPLIATLVISILLLIFGPSTNLTNNTSSQELIFQAKITGISEQSEVYFQESDDQENSNFDPEEFSESLENSKILNLKLEIVKEPENIDNFFSESQIGKTIELEQNPNYLGGRFEFHKNDKLMIAYFSGTETYQILDFVRSPVLFWLLLIFVAIVVIVTKWQGIGSIIGMVFSFLVLFKLILPQILNGNDPVFAVILGAILIIPATFFLSHGTSRKTLTAVLGTLFTLVFTGFLAKIFANLGNLSGLTSEEASFLSLEAAQNINFKSLVLAGMIVGIIGILDDITISQASVVQQLKNTKTNISRSELFKRAMVVGKDHIASMVNTLVLIYAGASLPLLLLFLDYNEGFGEVINQEFMSQEIIETLVGSIGLILAVPFTTFLAVFFIKENPHDHHAGCQH